MLVSKGFTFINQIKSKPFALHWGFFMPPTIKGYQHARYVNHKADRGGATNFGVTIGTYGRYLGRKVTNAQVKAISKDTARDIYKKLYYERPRLHILHDAIQAQMFDCCINHGSKNPIKWLQKITKQATGAPLAIDGVIGNKTAAAVNAFIELAGSKVANNAMVEERREFYERLIKRRPAQEVFRRGWMRRAKEFLQ